jgi:hypothetical protein
LTNAVADSLGVSFKAIQIENERRRCEIIEIHFGEKLYRRQRRLGER